MSTHKTLHDNLIYEQVMLKVPVSTRTPKLSCDELAKNKMGNHLRTEHYIN